MSKIENVKLNTIKAYAFDGGNRRGFPWKNLEETHVLFATELRQPPPPPAEGEEVVEFVPDKRIVLVDMVLADSANEESMKKLISLFRNKEPETWAIAQSICEMDVLQPIRIAKTEEGNSIVMGAHRFMGALIRHALAKLAKSEDSKDTIRAEFIQGEVERLIDTSNHENIHRRPLLKSSLARQAYEYHLRGINDQSISERLSLVNGRQKVAQYRKVYQWCIENNKEHFLQKWDNGEATLDALLQRAKGDKNPKNLEKKKTRTRTLPYARAYEIYNNQQQLEALLTGKTFSNPLEAVQYGMRIVMQCAEKANPPAATGKPVKQKKEAAPAATPEAAEVPPAPAAAPADVAPEAVPAIAS